jgi:hypothetical protein
MSTLIIALQTEGEVWEELPLRTKDDLTRWISREAKSESQYNDLHAQVETSLAYSPFTGKIASIAVFDVERAVTAVYVSGEISTDLQQDGVLYKTRPEAELLEEFWKGVVAYDTVVTWSGRRFVIPFLLHRSSAHKVRPTVNLLEQRYLHRQASIRHIDLLDQLTFYGAMNRRPSLYLLCAAYNLPLPPEIQKSDTPAALARKTIAVATSIAALYEHWLHYMADEDLFELDF